MQKDFLFTFSENCLILDKKLDFLFFMTYTEAVKVLIMAFFMVYC